MCCRSSMVIVTTGLYWVTDASLLPTWSTLLFVSYQQLLRVSRCQVSPAVGDVCCLALLRGTGSACSGENVAVSKPRFFAISWGGVTPSSKILHTDSTSVRECRGQKTKKIMHTLFVYQASHFSNFGGPYLRIGGRYPHALITIR